MLPNKLFLEYSRQRRMHMSIIYHIFGISSQHISIIGPILLQPKRKELRGRRCHFSGVNININNSEHLYFYERFFFFRRLLNSIL